LETSLFIHIW